MLDGIGDRLGDGHLEIKDAIVWKLSGSSDRFHEPSGFRELRKVGRDDETEEPVLPLRPRRFRHRLSTFQSDHGLVGTGKHAKIRSGGQSRDFKEAKEIGIGGYDADPPLLPHLAERKEKDGKAATIEVRAVSEIHKEAHAICA
jgi:hypothetical protein